MTLRESELSRSRHAARKRQKQHKRKHKRRSALAAPFSLPGFENDDSRVLTFAQWAALNGIGLRTARRLVKSGNGPAVVQLSDRRIGITIRANREWQESRERA
jgi:hypothetical protein